VITGIQEMQSTFPKYGYDVVNFNGGKSDKSWQLFPDFFLTSSRHENKKPPKFLKD
jgi:hypothetical protein